MKIKIHKTVKHSLFIEEKDLKYIFDFLKSKYKEIEIKSTCVDGSIIESKDINEIIEFYNPNYRKIKMIEINAYNSREDLCLITIGENNSFSLFLNNSAEIFIISESYEGAKAIEQELINLFLELKPFYDWFARISIFSFLITLWFGISLLIYTGQMFGLLPKIKSEFTTLEILNFSLIILILLFLITYPIDYLRKWIFPFVFFNIGNQKREAEKIKYWRNIVFNTFILGIIVSLLATLIYKLLF
jgi:hypothetical protein